MTPDEWLALPWWQRRLLLEQLREVNDEKREAQEAAAAGRGGSSGRSSSWGGLDAIYKGSIADVARSTPFAAG